MNVNKKFTEILADCDNNIEIMKKEFDKFLNHKIEVGDTVTVIDWGQNYSTWKSWFIENNIPIDLCLRYAYNTNMLFQKQYEQSDEFKVLAVHDKQALITKNYENSSDTPCYLIGIDALDISNNNK